VYFTTRKYGIVRKDMKIKRYLDYGNKMKKRFALCVDNKGYEASLIPRKFCEVIPDEQAQQDDFVRVIDESGEDYLYHDSHFIFIDLPDEVERVLVAV
jgi:hypothetical protein